jgi:hypothetical protein
VAADAAPPDAPEPAEGSAAAESHSEVTRMASSYEAAGPTCGPPASVRVRVRVRVRVHTRLSTPLVCVCVCVCVRSEVTRMAS